MRQRLFHDGFPLDSITALINEEFKIAGELMALSLAQGGPPPCIFAKEVFDYVVVGVESVTAEKWEGRIGEKAKLLIKQVDEYCTV